MSTVCIALIVYIHLFIESHTNKNMRQRHGAAVGSAGLVCTSEHLLALTRHFLVSQNSEGDVLKLRCLRLSHNQNCTERWQCPNWTQLQVFANSWHKTFSEQNISFKRKTRDTKPSIFDLNEEVESRKRNLCGYILRMDKNILLKILLS
jgi:DNA polymerase III delta prime subunit